MHVFAVYSAAFLFCRHSSCIFFSWILSSSLCSFQFWLLCIRILFMCCAELIALHRGVGAWFGRACYCRYSHRRCSRSFSIFFSRNYSLHRCISAQRISPFTLDHFWWFALFFRFCCRHHFFPLSLSSLTHFLAVWCMLVWISAPHSLLLCFAFFSFLGCIQTLVRWFVCFIHAVQKQT